jgi:hypothetical protein
MLIPDLASEIRRERNVTKLRFLQLTALILLAFRAEPLAAQDDPEVCNDGQIPVSVARAYKDMHNWPSDTDWTVQGWYTVSSGQCKLIGPGHYYTVGNEYLKETYSLTLLVFAFTDSTGMWGAARVAEPDKREAEKAYEASNQQLCVQNQAFFYTRSTGPGEPAKECDRGLAGYYRMPASLAYYGENNVLVSKKTLHVSLGPSDRAIPLGTSGGAAPKTATPGGGSSAATVGTKNGTANSTTAEAGDADALRLKQYPACNVITKAEAEAVLGVSTDPPEPGINLCRYQEPGYGTDSSKKKQVTVGIWRSKAVSPEDVNNRRNAIIKDKSLLPVSYKELPDFGDAALWVWAGGYYGALYAYRGGMIEVAVKISGVPESVALSTAKTFAARALGGASKTGYVYAARNQ